jgi:transposase-like protein
METQVASTTSMTCPKCGNASKLFGHHRNGLQRYRCLSCKKTFTEPQQRPFRVEDYLNDPKGQMAIRMLVEGCSVRTVERLTGIRRDSIIDLLLIAGQRCEKLMNSIRNVPLTDIQMDECWNFILLQREEQRPGRRA